MTVTAYTLDNLRIEASRQLDPGKRGALGQYMTPAPIASFMASLFAHRGNARLLDAGAGIGSLASAFLNKAMEADGTVDIDAWEIDATLRHYLKNTLESHKQRVQGRIKTHIHATDFIEDAVFEIQMGCGKRYTHAILNPPYSKIKVDSRHRRLLRMVGIETVNLYTAFAALASLLLEKDGELVAITPRSFCNGPYYRPFRELILRTCALRQLHLFESRSKAFQDDEILQESVISHWVKGATQTRVVISTSHDANFDDYKKTDFDAAAIVKPDDGERFIHIPTTYEQAHTPELCAHALHDIGLEVCTGPVVDFRLKDYWREEPSEDTAPLLYAHHFAEGCLRWPKPHHKKPNALQVCSAVNKWLMPRGYYVLVKRFSAKEQRRRVVAYALDPAELNAPNIGFENHWNVFHANKQGLDGDIAKGLAIFLNSSLFDTHFRSFSGHTQVNATDLRAMKYPSPEQLRKLGRLAGQERLCDQAAIDRLTQELRHQ